MLTVGDLTALPFSDKSLTVSWNRKATESLRKNQTHAHIPGTYVNLFGLTKIRMAHGL